MFFLIEKIVQIGRDYYIKYCWKKESAMPDKPMY